jgi:hypothetical protein
MNTTQFGWVRNKMENKPQPVPPIFEPEVGARAVYWAAHHNRREVYVGTSSVGAIVGNKVAPGMLDKYLAKSGYKSQQTSQPEDQDREDNLFTAVDDKEDRGAHGHFDDRSYKHSVQLWADLHRRSLGIGTAVAAAVTGALLYRYKRAA